MTWAIRFAAGCRSVDRTASQCLGRFRILRAPYALPCRESWVTRSPDEYSVGVNKPIKETTVERELR